MSAGNCIGIGSESVISCLQETWNWLNPCAWGNSASDVILMFNSSAYWFSQLPTKGFGNPSRSPLRCHASQSHMRPKWKFYDEFIVYHFGGANEILDVLFQRRSTKKKKTSEEFMVWKNWREDRRASIDGMWCGTMNDVCVSERVFKFVSLRQRIECNYIPARVAGCCSTNTVDAHTHCVVWRNVTKTNMF